MTTTIPSIKIMDHPLKHLNAGQTLFLEGDGGDEMYIVRTGHIRILKQEGRKSTDVALLGPGAVLGEMSLLDGGLRSASAIAAEPADLFVIGKNHLDQSLLQTPAWFAQMIRILIQRLRQTTKLHHMAGLRRALSPVLKAIIHEMCIANINTPISLENIAWRAQSLAKISESHSRSVCDYLVRMNLVTMEQIPKKGYYLRLKSPHIFFALYRMHREIYIGRQNPLSVFSAEEWTAIEEILAKKDLQNISMLDLSHQAGLSMYLSATELSAELSKILSRQNWNLGEVLGFVQMKKNESQWTVDINNVLGV